MSETKHHKRKNDGFNFGHLSSQKFAGMVFCVFTLFTAAFFLPMAAFGNLVMGVTGLYAAFVGGRAFSDGQALKYGGTVSTGDQVSVAAHLPTKPASAPKDDSDQEID